jgi:amino acid adenylation domain-containing protein
VAVVDGDRSLTYEELDRLSNQLARALLTQGMARGDRVGILARKSAASVVAVYAALKCGACYVPLDINSPDERLALIMIDSEIPFVVSDTAMASRAVAIAASAPRLRAVIVADPKRNSPATDESASRTASSGPVSVPWGSVLAERADAVPATGAIDTDLAYMLYTSGSTGTPKGVMISHRASLTFVEWAASCAGLQEQDRVCSPAPLHFDLSVFDIFASCKAGACMVVLPEMTSMFPVRLAEWIQQQQISVWYSVPSVLTMLANYGNLREFDLARVRVVIFAGEVFPAKHLSLLMAALPHTRYMNWYGPTETNVCTWFEVPPSAAALSTPVPIGRACANTDAFAVTSDGRRVSQAGEEGELFVRGSGVMSGYWGQPDKTRQALVRNPLQANYDEPSYRTGDLVTLDEEGNYVFLGRRDGMVKTRGYRVELGEVEAVLYGHRAVREAVVLPVPDELVGNRLRAIVCIDRQTDHMREELLEHCRRRLPAYMVPEVVEFWEALPRTSTGKVDRVRLAST